MKINKLQVFIGALALIIGCLIYIICSSEQVYFVPSFLSQIKFPESVVTVTRNFGDHLPDFIHPFAFILLTAGLVSLNTRKYDLLICLGWFFWESCFEFGQYFKEEMLEIIPYWFESLPILDHSKNFFLYGTFDVLDLIAFLLGSVAAYYLLLITSKRRIG